LFIITLVSTSDTLAYFGGQWLGKHKLTSISPKKTIEGTLIGFFSTIAMGISFILITSLPYQPYLIITLSIAILAPIGDLYESLFKRFLQVKDSSTIFPGHGGIYDRMDSYALVLPLTYYLLLL